MNAIYCKTWAVLKAECSAKGIEIGDPCNIHALGIVPKNEHVCRVTMDATNAGYAPDALSVNMLSPDRLCPYPVNSAYVAGDLVSSLARSLCILVARYSLAVT